LTPRVAPAGAIADEASRDRELSQHRDCRNLVEDSQCSELLAFGIEKYILTDNQRACPHFFQLRKSRIEIAFGAGIQDLDL
jgi:hypothetical protein